MSASTVLSLYHFILRLLLKSLILSAKTSCIPVEENKSFKVAVKIGCEVNNLVDYATGVETGLDSNGRKNRGGHLMENLVESFIQKAGFTKGVGYFKEMYIHQITNKWNIDLSAISNKGKSEKRFDFVIKTANMIYGIETNFYSSSGSKLNETARSYKTLALETEEINGFTFVWFTDGKGWNNARHNLEETFDVMEHIYNIKDLEDGIISEVFK